MRELKFRAWQDGELLEEVTPIAHADNDICQCLQVVLFDQDGEPNGTEDVNYVEQYTGVKDKNGKEIYEGDIVAFGDGWIGEVVWSDDNVGFCYLVKNGYHDNTYLSIPLSVIRRMDDYKVIGNIHENEGLLK